MKNKKIWTVQVLGNRDLNSEHFEQFDAIFGDKPNISPLALASSLRDLS